ncbi:MAG TPA: 16S rRNA (cytosine(1402)-N(4))-methyltransferase RsmH [Bacteroidia bacterium]|nr:16S rRNA (cytosine(1402)-N(4))-methyltransferase RsmH [Bacteroidota bacterium]MBK7431670.1 16S rRNA (cytosine(1402)-N(4))-methyltransferase RsmH [Bacteroidota bacterium]MBK7570764.1 16S rRNA (cytosine(1402)-N(4))-methyltransferase RsmH [Bacteroidota bacterium]MBP9923237.1 16S rRNA (cytosine(1402)-N(4))-methyltransferase RsmH [Bacteroidia bacterium]HQW21878.1 16S rRNA (cytosine(1402)-N(4))-methyltransferase RsmH [Bacteroidia bacterium]
MTTYHEPALLNECIEALDIKPDGVYVDVTFGGGGHSKEILKRLGDKGRLIAFDQDEDAERNAIKDPRFVLVRQNYRFLKNFLRYYDAIPVDGILADLGISSYQINEAERGFSIRYEAELDMRMNRESKVTAADILNQYSEEKLLKIFSQYGEVHNSKTLAKKIVEVRKETKLTHIDQFKEAIRPCVDKQAESQYYAKVFQALRIEVNEELESLKEMLLETANVLATQGRLVVLSYHSLEDRLVKNIIAKGQFEGEVEKDVFGNQKNNPFKAINRKPIEATEEEVKRNPRSRSAKLRIAEKN